MQDIVVNYILLKNSIVLNFEAQNFTVTKGTEDYDAVLKCIKEDTLSEIPSIVCKAVVINKYIPDGEFVIYKGMAYSHGEQIPGYIGSQLLMFAENDLPYEYLLNFWKKVKDNPSTNSQEQLYRFLEQSKCPIAKNGNFIAYKAVTKTLQAKHDNTVQYTMGEPMVMNRKDVVDDPSNACGPGLHVGSYKYASDFASGNDIILEVEVDPGDVVSVPTDSNSGKLRACKITPINICNGKYDTAVVAEDEGHVSDVTATQATEADVFIINRMEYHKHSLTADEFEQIISDNNKKAVQLVRVTPSKMPKSIRTVLDIKVGYRYIPNKNAAPVYLVCTTSDEYCNFETEAASKASANVAPKVKKAVVLDTIEIARKPHEIVKLSDKGVKAATENGTIHIRPSKYPVAIKRNYPAAEKCVRVIDKTKSVYLVQDGTATYLISEVQK